MNRNIFTAMVVITTTASFQFGYNTFDMNQPYMFIRQFFNQTITDRRHDGTSPTTSTITILWSVTNAVYVIGLIVGYFMCAPLADRIGRKNAILVGQVCLVGQVWHVVEVLM